MVAYLLCNFNQAFFADVSRRFSFSRDGLFARGMRSVFVIFFHGRGHRPKVSPGTALGARLVAPSMVEGAVTVIHQAWLLLNCTKVDFTREWHGKTLQKLHSKAHIT